MARWLRLQLNQGVFQGERLLTSKAIREMHAPQSVIRADRAVFGKIAGVQLNPVAALLRGELHMEGDWRLLVLVQRLFPGPATKKRRRRAAGYAKRRT